MNSPQNYIWGPALWTILHSATEKIGSINLKRLPQEETRIWLGLLSSLRYSLPCPLCKKHYTQYFSTVPITVITKENIREWLFNLHSQVNTRTNKNNNITIDELPLIYSKPFCFTHHFNILSEQMLLSLKSNWSKREDVQRTIRFLQELKRLYDFF